MTQQLLPNKRKSIKTLKQKRNEEKEYIKIKDIKREISKSISNDSMTLYRSKDNQISSNSISFDFLNLKKKKNSIINEPKNKNMEKGKTKNYKKKPLVKSLEKSSGSSKKLTSKKKSEKNNNMKIKNTKTSNFILKNEMSKSYKKNKLKSKAMTNIIKNEESFNASKSNFYGNTERGIDDTDILRSGELSAEDKIIKDNNYSFEKKEEFNLSNRNSIDSTLRKNPNFQYHKMCTTRDNNNNCNRNINNMNINNMTIDYDLEKKQSDNESKEDTEPENAILKLKKYATLRQELSILNEDKFCESSEKIDNNFLPLKSKKNLDTLKKNSENSKNFSIGDIKNGNKERYTDLLTKRNTSKKNKLSKLEEKKSTLFKERNLSESRNKVKKYDTTKINGILFKQKKKRSLESNTDMGMQTTRSLYTKRVYITDNIKVLEMESENRYGMNKKNKKSLVDELKKDSLEKQKKDRYQENERKTLKSMRSLKSMKSMKLKSSKSMKLKSMKSSKSMKLKSMKSSKSMKLKSMKSSKSMKIKSMKIKSMKSLKSLGTIDEYKEGEFTNREKGKIEQYLNGIEEKKYNYGIGDDKIEDIYEKEGKFKSHKKYGDYRDVYFSGDLGSGDALEVEMKQDKYIEIDPMEAEVDVLLNKYINYKRKVYKNQKRKSKLILEPLKIEEKTFKIDIIKFLSGVQENTYYDDILFFFDNYELKKKKNDDLLKLFKKLFKSEYFELEGIRSLLIIYDRILKKLQKTIETYPLKSIFGEAVKEMEKQREEERMKQRTLEFKALYKNEKLKDGLVLERFVTTDKEGYTRSISSGLSLLNATDNLVEIKIKRLKNHPGTHVNLLNDLCTNKNNSVRFIPLLLRKHWHDQKKLCILKQKLEEMKRRKTPKYLQIANTKTDTKKCCPLNVFGLCLNYSDEQNNTSKYDVQLINLPNVNLPNMNLPNMNLPNIHPQYPYTNYHKNNSCCCSSSKRQSYKISDAIHFLSS